MPRGDGTGPMGMGSMTGRGAGYCAGAVQPGYGMAGFGRGQGVGRRCATGWGMGLGRGFRRGPGFGGTMTSLTQPPQPETEKQLLKNQANTLQAELKQIQKRLAALDAAAEETSDRE